MNQFFQHRKIKYKSISKTGNRYIYISYKSAHPRHTIKNYVAAKLKRYVRINTEELNFLKIKNSFFLRMRNYGFSENKLSHWFSEVKYSDCAKLLTKKPVNTRHF